ncbi:hypothetical protein BJY52DRAFT_1126934 [Lactarius psammicola]|nr:hypothetical protein BJY52DRAFT_1126934 [Lactarius psammicola]
MTAYYVHTIGIVAILYALPHYWKQLCHTSALTGVVWVKELKCGHPDHIWTELGMCLHIFIALVAELHLCGLADPRHVGLEKQVAIFLYMLVTGLSIQHVAERFQHLNETISNIARNISLP